MAIRNAHPRPKYVYLSMGLSLEALGKRTEAMEAYRKAVAIDPAFAPAKERLSDLEDSTARERALAARGKHTSIAASALSSPVVIAALPGNQITSVRADAEPATWRPSPAVATEPAPPPMLASFTLRPTLEDREGAVAHAPLQTPATPPAAQMPTPAVERVVVPAQIV